MRTLTLFISLLLSLGVLAQKQVTIRNAETGEEMSLTVPDGLTITASYQEENGDLAGDDANIASVADTIDAESLNLKEPVTQHKWATYEYIDTCTARYAVVHDWNGRCGIYDLEKKERKHNGVGIQDFAFFSND